MRMIWPWVVRSRQAQDVLGCISLRQLARRQQTLASQLNTARFGIALLPSHIGKGLGSEASRAILARAIDAFDLHSIVSTCEQDNVRAHQMLDALGFAPMNQFRASTRARVDRIMLTDCFRQFAPTQADQLRSHCAA
jgi:RimJ/RimL family protein N-acetyltransferase